MPICSGCNEKHDGRTMRTMPLCLACDAEETLANWKQDDQAIIRQGRYHQVVFDDWTKIESPEVWFSDKTEAAACMIGLFIKHHRAKWDAGIQTQDIGLVFSPSIAFNDSDMSMGELLRLAYEVADGGDVELLQAYFKKHGFMEADNG